jgi:hypothetical protein
VRVTPSLDTLNTFYICNPAEDSFIESDPVVTFTGQNYLVVWSDEKYGPSNVYHPFAARVTPAGVVLDSGTRVSTSGVSEYRPNVADDGRRSLVVWSGSLNGAHGRFVNREGMPEGNVFQLAPGTASGPNLCFGDSCYLAAWHAGTYPALELHGSLVSREGELIGSTIPIATGTGCHRWADVAHDGTHFLVVWITGENNLPTTIYGQFVGDDGSLVGGRFAICGSEPQPRWWPALAYSDSNCLVAWEQGSACDVYGNVDITVTGLAEAGHRPSPGQVPEPTILAGASSVKRIASYVVFDALGRRSTALKSGVYFVRVPGPEPSAVGYRKVLRIR